MKNCPLIPGQNDRGWSGKLDGWRAPAFALCAILLLVALSGCGGGSNMITLQVSPSGTISMDEGQTQVFVATLGLDTANKGVTWTLTGTGCAGTGCGMISSTTASQITYTSPTGLTTALTVQLKAVANDNAGATVTVNITVNLAPMFTTTVLPNGTNGVGYSQQVVAEDGVTPYKFAVACTPAGSNCLPPGLTVNPNTGSVVGTPTKAGTYTFAVSLTDNAFAPLTATSDVFTVVINPATALTITSTVLPNATVGSLYGAAIQASGGTPPYSWSVPANTLPPGLNLNMTNGQIFGTPTTGGVFSFFPTVTDSTIPPQTFTSPQSKPVTITVTGAAPLKAVTPTLPSGAVATAYSGALVASGGVPPYTWSITAGQLPSGLRFDPASGAISGVPILVTTSNFTVKVTDSIGSTPASQNLSITINTGAVATNKLLTGSYSFLFNGFDSAGNVVEAGNFSANGSGVISSGQFDSNRVSGVFTASTLTGTYTIGNDGRGTMQLIGVNSKGAMLTTNYLLAEQSNGNFQIVENDTVGTPQTHGAGIMKPDSSSTLTAGNFSGNYAFEFIGQDVALAPAVIAGVVHANGLQNFSPGTIDVNDAGTYSPALALSGNYMGSGSNNKGLAVFTYRLPSSAQVQAEYTFYFVSPSDLFLVAVDTTDTTHPRLAGEMILQDSSVVFNSGALQGPSVATGSGLNGKNADVYAGLLTGDGNSVADFTFDENSGGTVSNGVGSNGTFVADPNANGRIQFTGVGAESTGQKIAAAYLTGKNTGFTIGSNPEVSFGLIEAQTSVAPFSASSLQGGYTLGAPSTEDTLALNVLGQLNSPGQGSLLGVIDEVDNDGTIHSPQNFVGNYNVGTTGRGTMSTNSPIGIPANVIFYIVSQSSFRGISGDSNPNNGHPLVLYFNH
ncbi:MAG TPA: Ig domain-containing protein [Candidatus Acidoferrales bacterium]